MNETSAVLPIHLLRQLSHDLRSPVNAISGTNAMLLEGGYGELNEKQTRAMQRIDRNTKRVLLILDQFMTYARANAGQYDLVSAPFAPHAVIDKAIDALRPLLPADVTLTLTLTDDPPATLHGDAAVLARCLDVLLCNAVAYTTAGKIQVKVAHPLPSSISSEENTPHPLAPSPKERGDTTDSSGRVMLVIDVTDTGTGIDAETQATLFTPFAPGAQPITPVSSSGCGLGLALCRALATQAGGTVELVSTSAAGSHFRLRLPYAISVG